MKALVQRVSRAAVSVDGAEIARIGPGLLVFLGVAASDLPGVEARLAERCADFRIFEDDQGRMNRSVREIGGSILVVPQFTLLADTARGRRPSFALASAPERAEPAFQSFCGALAKLGVTTGQGRFGACMEVELINQGPATFLLEA